MNWNFKDIWEFTILGRKKWLYMYRDRWAGTSTVHSGKCKYFCVAITLGVDEGSE